MQKQKNQTMFYGHLNIAKNVDDDDVIQKKKKKKKKWKQCTISKSRINYTDFLLCKGKILILKVKTQKVG